MSQHVNTALLADIGATNARFALLAGGAAWAQSTPAPAANAPASGSEQAANSADQEQNAGALQEVVVTAERRSEDVQTTPISVAAVSV